MAWQFGVRLQPPSASQICLKLHREHNEGVEL